MNTFKSTKFNTNSEYITIIDYGIESEPIRVEKSIIQQVENGQYFIKRQYFFPEVTNTHNMFINNTWKPMILKNYELSQLLVNFNFILPNTITLGKNTAITYTPWKLNLISLKDLIEPDEFLLKEIKKTFNKNIELSPYFKKVTELNNWNDEKSTPFDKYKSKLLLFKKYFLPNNTKLKIENFNILMTKLTKLLEILKSLNLSHQNINPDNIFLEMENDTIKEVYLGDFGDNKKLKISEEEDKESTQQFSPIANKLSNSVFQAPERYFLITQYKDIIGAIISTSYHNSSTGMGIKNTAINKTLENLQPLITMLDGGKQISNIYIYTKLIGNIKHKLDEVAKFDKHDTWINNQLLLILKKPLDDDKIIWLKKYYINGDFKIDSTKTKCKINFKYEDGVVDSIFYVYAKLIELMNYDNVVYDYYSLGINLMYYWTGNNLYNTTALNFSSNMQDKYRKTYSMYRNLTEDQYGTIFDKQILKYIPKTVRDKIIKLSQLIPEMRS